MLFDNQEGAMAALFLLSTASLYFQSLRRSFQLAGTVGFDGVELSLTPASVLSRPARMQALARPAGLRLASLHPPTVPLPGWGRAPKDFARLARLARALPDCRVVVLHAPAAQDEHDPAMRRFRRILDILQEGLEGSSVVVGLENRNQRPGEPLGPLDHPEDLASFARQHGCRIVLDTAHASTLPLPLLETYAILRDLLINVHLSDVRPAGWWERFSYPRSIFSHHRIPGQGVLPLSALLQSLAQDDYQELITLELSPVTLQFWRPSAAATILRHSLATCRFWMEP